MPTLSDLQAELVSLTDPAQAAFLQGFFKTGPGQYAEGDRFRGIRMPVLRRLVATHRSVTVAEAEQLLHSPWHEDRMVALLLWCHHFAKGSEVVRGDIYRRYLANTAWVNNWDLVDCTTPNIVGEYLLGRDLAILDELARSPSLWERRIAMLATFPAIKARQFGPPLHIATLLLHDPHDLIHKAVGWLLREIGKRDLAALDAFLAQHAATMPRTMLRYAIERHPEPQRKAWLNHPRKP